MKIFQLWNMILLLFSLFSIDTIETTCPEPRTIKIGVLTQEGYPPNRIGAFNLAKSLALQEDLSKFHSELRNYRPKFKCLSKMNVEVNIQKIDRYKTLQQIAHWITKENYDGIFQFIDDACDYEAAMAGALNVTFLAPECSHTQLSEKEFSPKFARTNPPVSKAVKSIIALMHQFSWKIFSLVSSTERKYKLAAEVLKQLAKQENIVMQSENFIEEGNNQFRKSVRDIIKSTQAKTRIYVLMASMFEIVDFIREMDNLTISDSGEYVIICVIDKFVKEFEVYNQNVKKVNTKYYNTSINSLTSFAERSTLFIAPATPKPTVYEAIGLAICEEGYAGICNLEDQKSSERSIMFQSMLTVSTFHTFDITMIFFIAVDNILQRGDSILNGQKILLEIFNRSYRSINGLTVYMDINGYAQGNFTVSSYNEIEKGKWSLQPVAYFVQEKHNTNLPKFTMFSGKKISWILGNPPTYQPKCGFSGENCKVELNVLALSICISMIIFLSIVALSAVRYWIIEQKLSSLLWKIDFKDILMTDSIPEFDVHKPRLLKDIDNHYSFLVADEFENRKKLRHKKEIPKTYTKIGSYRGMIVSLKFVNHKSIELTRKLRQEMQFFKDMNQENLNRIIGACIDPPNICIVTLYCSRGSLKDILSNKDIYLDDIFVASLLFDLIKAMIYLHDSQINFHGNLRTSKCLVDSRWILQVAGFGLQSLRYNTINEPLIGPNSEDAENYYFKLLWKSPEQLKEIYPMHHGSQKGDIYSFAIIFHELTHQSGPWGDLYKPGNGSEIIRKLKSECQSDVGNLRPVIDDKLVPNFVEDCLTDCWDSQPDRRPDFKLIRVSLKPLLKGLRSNIFDNMLLIMEKYAKNLEVLVGDRTWQLTEEKKKIERLLLRMLPKSVTEQLKVGQAVIPEHYNCVTIYFSDIVGFTSLSASSTPMEVVQMLNDLYTLFDSIITEYDVYKVETIGDAYMVVSGLPMRNGDLHVGEIASLSLHLLKAIKSFVIRHRPNETLKLRIGLHSGPCVAGVVGLRMPRYCLFGDTVNTASRMEATGQALMIHTSEDTKKLLCSLGGYFLTERGVIQVKGKGDMVTYFLEREDPLVRKDRLSQMKVKETLQFADEVTETYTSDKSKFETSEDNDYANEFLRKISSTSHTSLNNIHPNNHMPNIDFREYTKPVEQTTHMSNLYKSNSSWRSSSYPTKSENIGHIIKSFHNGSHGKNGSFQLQKETCNNHFLEDIDTSSMSLLRKS